MDITDDHILANWIAGMGDEELEFFISITEAGACSNDPQTGLNSAWMLGAARRWRDEAIDPIETLRATALDGFYEGVAG